MAEAHREGVKQSLLLVFIALSVILILFVWADNLIEKPGNQGFVRATPGAATAGPSATLRIIRTESLKTPTPRPNTPQTPDDPTDTPVPFQDSGDIGVLPPLPNPSLVGS